MQVYIYSREEMEKIIENDSFEKTAVISFCDSVGLYSKKSVDYKGKAKKLIQIEVDDIDFEELEDYELTLDTYFPQAEELARFIYDAYNAGLDIMCQCEYGQSRSAGCAAAIVEHFEKKGISIFRDYRYYPNKLIFNKVYEALEEERNNCACN